MQSTKPVCEMLRIFVYVFFFLLERGGGWDFGGSRMIYLSTAIRLTPGGSKCHLCVETHLCFGTHWNLLFDAFQISCTSYFV